MWPYLISILLVDAVAISIAFYVRKVLTARPSFAQAGLELGWGWFDNIFETLFHENKIRYAYFLCSLFVFILLCNWIGVLPFFSTVEIKYGGEMHPLLLTPTSSLSVTIPLALMSSFFIHFWAFKTKGLVGWFKHFFNNPLKGMGKLAFAGIGIAIFVGTLELVSEVVKIVSLSFRLYGNIMAGHAVIVQTETMAKWLVPIPFLLLETLVGLIQAGVFVLLTAAFLAAMTTSEGH